jgi:hypothetical protein
MDSEEKSTTESPFAWFVQQHNIRRMLIEGKPEVIMLKANISKYTVFAPEIIPQTSDN